MQVNHRGIEPDKKKPEKRKKVTYEHKEIIKQMLAVIHDVKMCDEIKMIIRMRIWGRFPNEFRPMTHEEIAKDIGTKNVDLIRQAEAEGLKIIKKHLSVSNVIDLSTKFDHKDEGLQQAFKERKLII
jgi:hypothetical protein